MKNVLFVLLLLISSQVNAWQDIASPEPYKFAFASTTAVNTIKSGPGFLHALTINGGTTSTIDIYDGPHAASSLMYSFSTTNTIATYILDTSFTSGCTIRTNGALKYTVSYK